MKTKSLQRGFNPERIVQGRCVNHNVGCILNFQQIYKFRDTFGILNVFYQNINDFLEFSNNSFPNCIGGSNFLSALVCELSTIT